MKRVVVIGSGGSGKSTFSRRLGEITGLPVVHLDKLYWRPGWIKSERAKWLDVVVREITKPEWIIDGNYGNTRATRMRAADTIIMLDLPRPLCIFRILKRTIMYREGSRPDMAAGCRERFDREFFMWVWNYPREGRQRALDEIAGLEGKRVVILKTRREVSQFLRHPYAN